MSSSRRARRLPAARWVATLGLCAWMATSLRAQPERLDALLSRAGEYVRLYAAEMANLVAEERYVQDVLANSRLGIRSALRPAGTHRVLRSDVLLVKVGPPLEWRPFRDVFEVDGTPVRDRDARLAALFQQPAADALAQALRIAQESARYNIGAVRRTLNTPGLPLMFLQPSIRERFRFTLDRPDSSLGPGVWIVKYLETDRPTTFRGNNDSDNPSSGRFWIDAETGAVLKAELAVSDRQMTAKFVTTFSQTDSSPVVRLPAELAEEYTLSNTRLIGTATYSHFRRFEVKTEIVTADTLR